MEHFAIYEEMLVDGGYITLTQCFHYKPQEAVNREAIETPSGRHEETIYQLTYDESVACQNAQRDKVEYKRQTYFSQLLAHLTCTMSDKKEDRKWDDDLIIYLLNNYDLNNPVLSVRKLLKQIGQSNLYPSIYRILKEMTGKYLKLSRDQSRHILRLFLHFCTCFDKHNKDRVALLSYNMILIEILKHENIELPFPPLSVGSSTKRDAILAEILLLLPQAVDKCKEEEARNIYYFGTVNAPKRDKGMRLVVHRIDCL